MVARVTLALLLACVCGWSQAGSAEDSLRRAIGLHQAGDIDGAIEAYRKYLAVRPDSAVALSNLGAAYARAGRYEEAISQYRRALKVQPGDMRMEMNLGLAYYKTGQLETAAVTLAKVHNAAPAELQPALLLADCWLAMGKDAKVIEFLSPLATERPDDLAIAYMLGMALVRDSQVERGQKVIDRILRNGDSAEARLLLGSAKLNANDNPAALVDLTKAVELDPKLPSVYSYYGQALLLTGDTPGAMEAFRKELASNPNDFISNLRLGVLLKEDGRFTDALVCLRRALQTRPGDLRSRYQIATIRLHEEQLDEARRDLEGLVKDAPNYREAHVSLATVYYRLKRKVDGDRERAIVQRLGDEAQAK